MDRPLLEVCLDSAASAAAAAEGGAERVELCANLLEGGTTPSAGEIAVARGTIDIGLHVMIRPRGGDFCYSALEIDTMLHDLRLARELGADGVVFGALLPDGQIDAKLSARLIEAARPLAVTFHRAFDMCRDPFEGLEVLRELGVERLLSSGQEPHVLEGLELLAALVEAAGEDLIVMPGCGVTPRNAARVARETGARELHIVGAATAESPMKHRNARCFMGTELRAPEYTRTVTSAAAVRAFVDVF